MEMNFKYDLNEILATPTIKINIKAKIITSKYKLSKINVIIINPIARNSLKLICYDEQCSPCQIS